MSTAVAIDLSGAPDPELGEISLGEPVRFTWIDFMGAPAVEIRAFVIDFSDDARVVLVDSSTLIVMAVTADAALHSSDYARAIAHLAPVAAGPMGLLYDVTDVAGGWDAWAQLLLEADAATDMRPSDVVDMIGGR